MKKILVIILGLILLLSLAGCSSSGNKQSSNNIPVENESVQTADKMLSLAKDRNLTIQTTVDVGKTYSNIDELVKDSNIVIEGKIEEAKTTFNTFGIYTNAKIKIINSFEGVLKPGDVIAITFRGGTIEGEDAKKQRMDIIKEKFGTVDNNVSSEKTEEKVNGLDNLITGDNVLLFINSEDNKYLVTGGYMGRFKITNDSVQLSEEFKDIYKAIKKDDFIKLIKDSVKKK